jgi:hypothetical protein
MRDPTTENIMKHYLAVYLGSEASIKASGWAELSEAARQEKEKAGVKAWKKWVEDHQDAIVTIGSPLGTTLRTSSHGVEKTRNALAGFTVVRAESHEAAAKLFAGHPHFTLFPGESVEVMECLPVPE